MTEFYTNVEKSGKFILYRGYKDGVPISRKIEFSPSFFLLDPNGDLKTLTEQRVSRIRFDDIYEANDFLKKYQDVDNFPVYGVENYVTQFLAEKFQNKIEFDPKIIKIFNVDIEVYSPKGFPPAEKAEFPITAITVKDMNSDKYYTWGTKDFDTSKVKENVDYIKCEDERELLSKFTLWWTHNYPDIVTGWNVRFFDIPYIINRVRSIWGDESVRAFSPWKYVRQEFFGRDVGYVISGISILDYMEVFKKFTLLTFGAQASYRLDDIAELVLKENKIDYSEYGNLQGLYDQNPQLFFEYNIRDVGIVDRMEKKLGLLRLAMAICYRARCLYRDVFGTVPIWDAILYKKLLDKGYVVPPKPKNVISEDFPGGWVKEPIPGLYKWVVSFDVKSEYPHCIMQWNMSPETIVNHQITGLTIEDFLMRKALDIPNNRCVAGSGQMFSTEKRGMIPEIIDEFYAERDAVRSEMIERRKAGEDVENGALDNEQMAIKLLMNSFYGALSNVYFRFYDIRIARAITMSGRVTIRSAEKAVNDFLNKILETEIYEDFIIAIDTDSIYINLGPLVEKFVGDDSDVEKVTKLLDKICKDKITKIISDEFKSIQTYTNCYAQRMQMNREKIANKAIWTGKKRYILSVTDDEGKPYYDDPKIDVTGIETVRSSTPKDVRDMLSDAIKVIMQGEERKVQEFIKAKRDDFYKLPVEKISTTVTVNGINKYFDASTIYKPGCPINTRAGLLHNDLLTRLKLEDKYDKIYEGNKIKYVYLKVPNRIHENIIGFEVTLPKEFDLHDSVDYDTQFNKVFVSPIEKVLTAVGWTVEAKASLDDFFA